MTRSQSYRRDEVALTCSSTGKDCFAKPSEAQKLLRAEISDDLLLLAMLHDREPQVSLIEELRKVPVENWFGLKMTCGTSQTGLEIMSAALTAFSSPLSEVECDQLAVDFANIYLIHTYRASPTESPWLDKDKLERQGPMFAIAENYLRHGLAASDRQLRSDDHLVLQLQFLSHLLAEIDNKGSLQEAAHFMDEHILRWFGEFAERVAGCCQTPYYAALVTLTNGYLEDLRDMLVTLADEPRPVRIAEDTLNPEGQEINSEDERYIPGVAPSW